MAEIIPAIIAKNYKEFEEKIRKVEPYVSWAQLDVSDGIFTKNLTFGNPKEVAKIKTKLKLEVHLMISSPEKFVDDWINSGVERILIHYESTRVLRKVLEKIKKSGIKAGVVLNLKTPVKVLDKLKNLVNAVQFMAISEIGFYGAKFEESVLKKIKEFHGKYPEIPISVDGGVDLKNAKELVKAGVSRLVSGSAIFGEKDIKKAIDSFKKI